MAKKPSNLYYKIAVLYDLKYAAKFGFLNLKNNTWLIENTYLTKLFTELMLYVDVCEDNIKQMLKDGHIHFSKLENNIF